MSDRGALRGHQLVYTGQRDQSGNVLGRVREYSNHGLRQWRRLLPVRLQLQQRQ
jgi:hypothetical protein